MIKAPYNFVPLNKDVFYPEWSKNVNHDIPFKDGECGMIGIDILAETPIYIRNHYQNGDDFYLNKNGEKISKEFCHIKDENNAKQYYIPGSSVKGMIRNIVEIISFSKIRVDETKLSKVLSVRDMTQDKNTGNIFAHDMVATAKKCGFLVKEDDKFYIEDCGNVLTIKENQVKLLLSDFDVNIDTAEDKYNAYGHVEFPFEKATVEIGGRNTVVAQHSPGGNLGSLVMTGAIDNKKNEFIFYPNENKILLKESIYNDFENVYFNNEKSVDGQYWKEEWKKGSGRKIPVFYTEENRAIKAIGLTQIFKLAYKKTLFDSLIQNSNNEKLDLADTIFGTEKKGIALKGRVQFSHMKSTHVTFTQEKSAILGSPQPTYFPNYLRQNNINGDNINIYKTLMDDIVEGSGYKRYPLHKNIKESYIEDPDKADIQTHFNPLASQSKFTGKIRFHNLKKAEIGALLSSLTFHGQEGYRHNIGMAKALGYGKINIVLNVDNLKYSLEEYLKAFENEMTLAIDNWSMTPQIKELFAMANNTILNDSNLVYQYLENPHTRDREKNDFTKAKKAKKYLKNYSDVNNVEIREIKSYADEIEIKQREEELAHNTLWMRATMQNTKVALNDFITKYPESEYLEAAKAKIAKIQEDEETAKKETAEKEAEDKWSNVLKNTKYLEQGLNDFIKNYPKSPRVKEAKVLLDEIKKPVAKVGLDGLSKARDGKKFKGILDKYSKNNSFSPEDIELVKKEALTTYKKRSNNFFKDAQIGRFIGKDIENELKNELKKEVGE